MKVEVRTHKSDDLLNSLVHELEKHVPQEVREDLKEMANIRCKIDNRMRTQKAISPKDVERFNSICYRHFGKIQDGMEFSPETKQKPQAEGGRIPYSERRRVYETAIEHYGIKPQIQMVIEEMSELTKELCKYFRGADNIEAIADEVADVTIMLEQLRLILGINDDVSRHMDLKVARLADRLGIEVSDGSAKVQ
jgi:hypothetical protein